MNADTFTVIVLYEGQKYGLIVPVMATVTDMKNEIGKHLGLDTEKQILSFKSELLENTRPITSYGIGSASVISLMEFNSNKSGDSEVDNLHAIKSILSDLRKNSQSYYSLMRDSDILLSELQQLQRRDIVAESVNEMDLYVRNCQSETSGVSETVSQLLQRFLLIQSECSRLQKRIQNKKNDLSGQVSDMLRPSSSSEASVHGVSGLFPNMVIPEEEVSEDHSPTQDESESEGASQDDVTDLANLPGVDVLQDYLIVLGRRHKRAAMPLTGAVKPIDHPGIPTGESIPDEGNNGDESNNVEEVAGESKEGEVDDLIELNDGDLAIDALDEKDAYIQEDEECAWDEEGDEMALEAELAEQDRPPRIYNIVDDEVDDLSIRADFELLNHTYQSAFVVLHTLENTSDVYQRISVLDLSYCFIGHEGWVSLITTFLDNTNLVLKELHLAGNNLGCDQINYLISQLNVEDQQQNQETVPSTQHFIFPYLRILNLNGNEGVRRLYSLMLHNCFPSLKQLFLMNNKLSDDIIRTLIKINYQESNPTNIVVPETQLAQLSENEHILVNLLYDKIDSKIVKLIEIGEDVTDICLQLYMMTMVTTIVNRVEKLVIHDVDMNNYRLHILLSFLRQYACYDRANVLKSVQINNCNLYDEAMPDICGLILLYIERSMIEFAYIGLEDNNFTDLAFSRLIETLLYACRSGLDIDFSIVGNPIGDAGAQLFFSEFYAARLEMGSSINLAGCMLTDLAIEYMHEVCNNIVIKGNSNSIKVLSLNENFFTDACVEVLTYVFSLCPRLHNISIEETDLTAQGIYAILNYFISNMPEYPVSFFFRYNKLEDAEKENLMEVFSANFGSECFLEL